MCEIASKHKNVRFLHLQTLHEFWIQTREQCVGPIAIQPLHTGQHLFTCVIKVVPLPYPLLARIGEEVLRLEFKHCQHFSRSVCPRKVDTGPAERPLHAGEMPYGTRRSTSASVRV